MAVLCSTSIRCGDTLESALSTIAGMGIKDVDVLGIGNWCHVLPADLVRDFEGTAGNASRLLEKYGLTMRSMNVGTNQQLWDRKPESNEMREKEIDALCRFMAMHGAKSAAIQPLANDYSGRSIKEVIDDCVLSLRQFIDISARYGIKMGVELHVYSPFETLEQVAYLFEKMPDAKIVYDPSHFAKLGIPLQSLPPDWMDRAVHVHSRDSGKDMLQAHLGQGTVDFAWMVGELKKRGYAGHYSIEYLQDKNDDYTPDAAKLYKLLTSLI